MKKIIVVLIATLISCTSVKDNNKLISKDKLRLELKKGPCFGTCPIFDVRLFENRLVMYNGKRFVEHQGTFEWYMDKSDFNEVNELLNSKDLAKSIDFNTRAQDLPLTSLSIYTQTDTITLKHKGAISKELKERLKKIESLVMTNAKWNE